MPTKSTKVTQSKKDNVHDSTSCDDESMVQETTCVEEQSSTSIEVDHSSEKDFSTSDDEEESDPWNGLELHEKVNNILSEISAFKQALRNLEPKLKEISKACKTATKGKKKTKQSEEKKKNHGVFIMHDVPDQVTNFLGNVFTDEYYDSIDELNSPEKCKRTKYNSGDKVSRKDLLTGVNVYIRLHCDKEGRKFTLDDNLKSILCKTKNKSTKEYEGIVSDTMTYTQIMGSLSYWFDPNIDHSSSKVSTA